VAEPQGGKTKGLVVATRCATLDEFITSFQRFCDDSSFFVATLTTRPVGLDTPFAILLADRTPVLRGLCTVIEAWTTPDNKYKVPGIRLGVKRLTPETADVFARLCPRVPTPPPIPPRRPTIASPPLVLHPLPPGLRLPSTDMDTIPPPISRNAPRATLNPLVPDPDLPDPDMPAPDSDGRIPGSELVLPANPLMNLTDDSLEGFVDCTLYEESPGFTRGLPVEVTPIELATIERARSTIPPPFARLTGEMSSVLPFDPTPSPAITPVQVEPAPRPPLPRWMLIAAPATLLLIVIVIVAASAGDAGSTTTAAKVTTPPSKPPAAAPAPKIAAAITDEAADEAEAAADPTKTIDGVPVVGAGPCQLSVSSTPAGSTVVVDGKVVGPSPIQLAGPCLRRKVDVVHPRYKRASEWVNLVEGKPGEVEVTMTRPTHRLTVTTVPAGATISIGGRRAGTSPTVIQLMGFSRLSITAEKTGYKPVTSKVYSKRPNDKLSLRLSRW
jgi:hypothetical protein